MTYSQNNIEQLFRLIGSFPNQQYGQATHYDFIKTKDSKWPNKLLNLKATEDDIEIVLDQIEKDSEKGAVPNVLMLNPTAINNSIIEKIKKRGYESSEWSGMTHNLKFLEKHNEIPDFQVKLVRNKSDLVSWLSIVESELMGNQSLSIDVFSFLLKNSNCYFFLGLERKQPVATSFLFVEDKGAGVYLVSTKESHRKKGFGQEMTRHCLLQAKELECEQVNLQATQLGVGVYKSLGFEKQGSINVFKVKRAGHSAKTQAKS